MTLLCDNLYPYAGVLGCPNDTDEMGVEIYRNPKRLKGTKLSFKDMLYMARAQSATLCRLAKKVVEQGSVIKKLNSR
ncbi:hypothetical protein ES704_01648 [subsurface metagenome]